MARLQYVRMDEKQRGRDAIVDALVAMQLGEHAAALLLVAIAVMLLSRAVPDGEAEELLRVVRAERARTEGIGF